MPADDYALQLDARITVLAEGFRDEAEARHAALARYAALGSNRIEMSKEPVRLDAADGTRLTVQGSVEVAAPAADLPEPVRTLLTTLMLHLADEPAPPPARARQRDALTSRILDLVSGPALRLSPPAHVPASEPETAIEDQS